MNCDVIKDLIPLADEELCSEESRRLIEEHIKTCESCRLIYGEPKNTEKKPEAKIPDERETFKKVNRKIKKLTWKTWGIGVMLIGVLSGLGYLTFGQITKLQNSRSFETVIQSFEVRKMAKMIKNADFDSYVDSLSDGLVDIFKKEYIDEVKEQDKKLLAEVYKKEIGDAKVKNIRVDSYYAGLYGLNSYNVISEVDIKYDNDMSLSLLVAKDIDGKYSIDAIGTGNVLSDDFADALNMASYHELMPRGLFEKRFLQDTETSVESLANRFAEPYREAVKKGKQAFIDGGFKMTDVYKSQPAYDKEKKLMYVRLTAEAADDKGTAVLTTKIYYDYKGCIPPENDEITVSTNGCTPELAETLRGILES